MREMEQQFKEEKEKFRNEALKDYNSVRTSFEFEMIYNFTFIFKINLVNLKTLLARKKFCKNPVKSWVLWLQCNIFTNL